MATKTTVPDNPGPYRAESFFVANTGETGWCVKLGDDTVCDVYTDAAMAERIAASLNAPAEPAQGQPKLLADLIKRLDSIRDDCYWGSGCSHEDALKSVLEDAEKDLAGVIKDLKRGA